MKNHCVIFDLDGTIADNSHRTHYLFPPDPKPEGWKPDWKEFHSHFHLDKPNDPIVTMLHGIMALKISVIICTGRFEHYREGTLEWFKKHFIGPPELMLMRPNNNHQKDYELKRSMLHELRKKYNYNPFLIVDDRSSVVAMWREEGLVCAQVADGDF